MRFENDTVFFESTGRREYCHGEGLSCHPSSPEMLYYGADGGFGSIYAPDALTPAEREEAAEYMIRQVKEWLEATPERRD